MVGRLEGANPYAQAYHDVMSSERSAVLVGSDAVAQTSGMAFALGRRSVHAHSPHAGCPGGVAHLSWRNRPRLAARLCHCPFHSQPCWVKASWEATTPSERPTNLAALTLAPQVVLSTRSPAG